MTSERIYVLFIYNLFIIFFSNHTRRIISLGWRNGFIHDDWFWSLMQSNDEGSLMKSPMTTAQHSTLMATVNLCASTLLCFQKRRVFFAFYFSISFCFLSVFHVGCCGLALCCRCFLLKTKANQTLLSDLPLLYWLIRSIGSDGFATITLPLILADDSMEIHDEKRKVCS